MRDNELIKILNSDHHVADAKMAAKRELEKRSGQSKESSLDTKNKKKPYILSKEEKQTYRLRMCSFGGAIILIAIYFNFETLLITQSSLIPESGTVEYSKTYIERVSARGRFGYKSYSNKATLELKFNEGQKTYRLFENIGQELEHDEFKRLTKLLNQSNRVTLWVPDSELEFGPEIFRLDIDGRTELKINESKSKNLYFFFGLAMMGAIFIYLGFQTQMVEKVRSFFHTKRDD